MTARVRKDALHALSKKPFVRHIELPESVMAAWPVEHLKKADKEPTSSESPVQSESEAPQPGAKRKISSVVAQEQVASRRKCPNPAIIFDSGRQSQKKGYRSGLLIRHLVAQIVSCSETVTKKESHSIGYF